MVISAAGALTAGREPAPKRPRDASGLSFDVGSAVAMAGDAARQGASQQAARKPGRAKPGARGSEGAAASRDDTD